MLVTDPLDSFDYRMSDGTHLHRVRLTSGGWWSNSGHVSWQIFRQAVATLCGSTAVVVLHMTGRLFTSWIKSCLLNTLGGSCCPAGAGTWLLSLPLLALAILPGLLREPTMLTWLLTPRSGWTWNLSLGNSKIVYFEETAKTTVYL